MSPRDTPSPKSFSHKKPSEKPFEAKSQEFSFFSKIRGLFGAIAEKIISQSRGERESLHGRVEEKNVAVSAEHLHLLKSEVSHLERVKDELLSQEGDAAVPFIIRYIEPFLNRLRGFLAAFSRVKSPSEPILTAETVVNQIVALKGGLLIQKIKDDLIESVHKAVYDDLACIASYQEIEGYTNSFIQSEIDTIVSILLHLTESAPHDESLISLYRWKHTVDIFRQGLLDLALMILDKQIDSEVGSEENEAYVRQISAMLRNLIAEKGEVEGHKLYKEAEVDQGFAWEMYTTEALRKSIDFFLTNFIDS